MPRLAGTLAMALALGCAYGVYAISAKTRHLQREVSALERERDRLVEEVQVLRGDRAYYARPARIEPLARLQGLAPLRPDQIITRTELERRLGP